MSTGRAIVKHVATTLAAIGLTAICLDFLITPTMALALREMLPAVRVWPIALSLALSVLINDVRTRRFLLAVDTPDPRAFALMFRVSALLAFLTNLLPFKIGEISFPVLARRALGTSFATSLGVLVYARVFDLLTVIALGGFALGVARPTGSPGLLRLALPSAAIAALTLLLLPLIVIRAHDLGLRWVHHARLRELLDRLFTGCRAVAGPRRQAAWLALTVASWVLQAACAYLAMAAISARPAILDGLVASAAAAVTFALPVNGIAGVGPMQAAWALALTVVGWKWEPAVASAFLSHATILASTAIIALGAVITTRVPPADGAR